jgi:regulatory protein
MPPSEPGAVPRISGIVTDPRSAESVRIQVDGRTLLTVPARVAERLGVRAGDVIGGPAHAALCRAADAEAAFRTALRALERRSFAARDLARRLVLKGHPPEAADQAVSRAQEAGLVNDENFARHFVQTRFARGRGPARLRRELTVMGVAAPLVDRVLRDEVPEEASREAILVLARKRAGQLKDVPRPDRFRRVIAYLARRGYRGPEVLKTAREITS